MRNIILVAIATGFLIGCSSISKLGLKTHKSKKGRSVTVGQYEPDSDDQCKTVKKLKFKYGIGGRMDKTENFEKMTKAAMSKADKYKSNYVYLDIPGDAKLGGITVNAFSDAHIVHYRCKKQIK